MLVGTEMENSIKNSLLNLETSNENGTCSGLETQDSIQTQSDSPNDKIADSQPTSPTPRLVQQTFHKSMFFSKNRSSALVEKPVTMQQKGPPEWQKVPTMQGNKRKKMSESPSPSKIVTSNSYSVLPIDLTEELPTKEKKVPKPPPIVLYGITDVNKLTELLQPAAEGGKFTYKNINKQQLRVNCNDVETYKKIITLVRENGLIGHTFNRKDERCFRIVIRNLHHTTPHSVIKEEIEKTGNIVSGEIINAKYGQDKLPTSTFFVNLLPGPNNKLVKNLKYIYHQAIVVEDPRKKRSIVQCQRCQQYGHSKNYCMRPYRCVKCAQSHKTTDCPKRDRNTPAKCALCQGAHPANYKGCDVYKEIATRKTVGKILSKKNSEAQEKSQQYNSYKAQTTFTQDTKEATQKSYAETLRSENNAKAKTEEDYHIPLKPSIEQMLLKQSERFELIIQQMSTLLSLITTLVNKLSR